MISAASKNSLPIPKFPAMRPLGPDVFVNRSLSILRALCCVTSPRQSWLILVMRTSAAASSAQPSSLGFNLAGIAVLVLLAA
ncbi:MAG TPA: hypothetical protein VL147_06730, partial [Devosia sp.]|nr:hypothetical protein [Devosia sp.]